MKGPSLCKGGPCRSSDLQMAWILDAHLEFCKDTMAGGDRAENAQPQEGMRV